MFLEVASHIVYDKEMADTCPFCGKDDLYLDEHESGTFRKFSVACRACGASGPNTKLSKKEAVFIWNQREPVIPKLNIPKRTEE